MSETVCVCGFVCEDVCLRPREQNKCTRRCAYVRRWEIDTTTSRLILPGTLNTPTSTPPRPRTRTRQSPNGTASAPGSVTRSRQGTPSKPRTPSQSSNSNQGRGAKGAHAAVNGVAKGKGGGNDDQRVTSNERLTDKVNAGDQVAQLAYITPQA